MQISNLTFDFPHHGLYETHLLYIRTAQLSLSNRTEPASSELSVKGDYKKLAFFF